MTARMSGPIHGSGVRPADCQAIDQSVALVQPEPVGHRHGGRTELVGVRVAGVDDALRQRVGGEQDVDRRARSPPHRRQPLGEIVGEELDEGRLGRPTLDADHRHGPAGAGRAAGRGTRRSSTTE